MAGAVSADTVLMGRIVGLFGIKGWVKVRSYTRPREAILDYHTWRLRPVSGAAEEWREFEVAEGRLQGPAVVVRLKGIEDRTAATVLVGVDIAVARAQLPKLRRGEHYWADLEGLRVINLDGVEFGRVDHLLETGGANDVLVVHGERERLIPYIASVIREVDIDGGVIRVDWGKDYLS